MPSHWSTDFATEAGTGKISKAAFTIMPDLPKDYFPAGKNRITEFTIQPGYCGMRGMGTELTPSDLTGDIASMNIVKHWAFDRYGIFPEFPRLELGIDEYSGKMSQPEKCVDDGCAAYGYCENSFEVVFGLSDGGDPDTCYGTASIAWLPSIQNLQGANKIVHFCDHRKCSKETNHNRNMTNTHNNLCKGLSTLDVILQNEDFAGIGTVPRKEITDTTPRFIYVHAEYDGSNQQTDGTSTTPSFGDQTTALDDGGTPATTTTTPAPKPAPTKGHHVVLVLDESGSMISSTRAVSRMDRLKSAAAQFVDITDDGIKTAVISFNHGAYQRAGLTVSFALSPIDFTHSQFHTNRLEMTLESNI